MILDAIGLPFEIGAVKTVCDVLGEPAAVRLRQVGALVVPEFLGLLVDFDETGLKGLPLPSFFEALLHRVQLLLVAGIFLLSRSRGPILYVLRSFLRHPLLLLEFGLET